MASKRTRNNDNGSEGSSKGPKVAKKSLARRTRQSTRNSRIAADATIKCHIVRTKDYPVDEEEDSEEPAVDVRASRRSTANDDYVPSPTGSNISEAVVTRRSTRRTPVNVEAANPPSLMPAADWYPEGNGGPAGDGGNAGDGAGDGLPTPPESGESGSGSGGSGSGGSRGSSGAGSGAGGAGGAGGNSGGSSSSSSESSVPDEASSSSSDGSFSLDSSDDSDDGDEEEEEAVEEVVAPAAEEEEEEESSGSSESSLPSASSGSDEDSDEEELEIGQRYICNTATKKGGNCKNVFIYRGEASGCHVKGHRG